MTSTHLPKAVLPAIQARYGRYWEIQVGRTHLNAGGQNWFAFVCDDCQYYTEYQHTWG